MDSPYIDIQLLAWAVADDTHIHRLGPTAHVEVRAPYSKPVSKKLDELQAIRDLGSAFNHILHPGSSIAATGSGPGGSFSGLVGVQTEQGPRVVGLTCDHAVRPRHIRHDKRIKETKSVRVSCRVKEESTLVCRVQRLIAAFEKEAAFRAAVRLYFLTTMWSWRWTEDDESRFCMTTKVHHLFEESIRLHSAQRTWALGLGSVLFSSCLVPPRDISHPRNDWAIFNVDWFQIPSWDLLSHTVRVLPARETRGFPWLYTSLTCMLTKRCTR